MNSQHKRQGSASSFSVDLNALNIRLTSLENFMFLTKMMTDDILVPTKLKEKKFDEDKINTIRNASLALSNGTSSSSNNQHHLLGVSNLNNSLGGSNSRHHSGTDDSALSSSMTAPSSPLYSLDVINGINGTATADKLVVDLTAADVLDHYRFILLVRNQFMQTNPFLNSEEDKHRELLSANANFKQVFDKIKYHYKELMGSLDLLSSEAKAIMEIYKEN